MKSELLSFDSITRRAFAEHVAKAALGVTILPSMMSGAESPVIDNTKLPGFGKAKRVIWLQMEGGMSHIDTLDPKEGDTKGPKDAIKTKAGYMLGGFFPKLAAEQSDKLTIIRSMTSPLGEHGIANRYLLTGYKPSPAIDYPSFGSVLTHVRRAQLVLPPYVAIPESRLANAGFLGSAFEPFATGGDPSKPDFRP